MSSVPPPPTQSEVTPPDPPATDPSPPCDDRRPDEPPWPPWTAPAAIGVGFGLGIVVSVIVEIAAQAGGSSISHPSPAVSLIGDFLFDAAFVAAAIYFAALRNPLRPADFGFRAVPWRLGVGSVLVAGISYY